MYVYRLKINWESKKKKSCVWIRCRRSEFTEPLPSNDEGYTYTDIKNKSCKPAFISKIVIAR
jgi:hypothetical protein